MTTSFPPASGQATLKCLGLSASASGFALVKHAAASVCSLKICLWRLVSCAFVLTLGMPYDIPIGNFDNRAIVSTSRLLTAVLKACQNVSNEESAAWPARKRI